MSTKLSTENITLEDDVADIIAKEMAQITLVGKATIHVNNVGGSGFSAKYELVINEEVYRDGEHDIILLKSNLKVASSLTESLYTFIIAAPESNQLSYTCIPSIE